MGRELGLVLFLAVSAVLLCTGDATEGGPSTFGYDASSACTKPYTRDGRARRLENLPCDFRRENWCTIAGNAYPWQAVRRFVQENQGLMRRMYGDEKHISVLKTELEKNDVEVELEDDHNQLYSDDPSTMFRQSQFEVDYEFDRDHDIAEEVPERGQRKRNRAMSISGSPSRSDRPKTAEDRKTHSHPDEAPVPTAITTIQSTSSPSTISSSSWAPSSTTASTTKRASHRTKITPVTSSTHQQQSISTSTTTTKDVLKNTTSSLTPTTPAVSLAQIAKIQNLSINEVHGQIDRFDTDVDELTEIPELLVEDVQLETTAGPYYGQNVNDDGLSTAHLVASSSSEGSDQHKVTLESYADEKEQQDSEVSESQQQQQQQQFRPRPEYRPPEAAKPEAATASMEGQLFQDVAAKDKQEPPVLKVRGINACPVKEEVVAPFWANNTRGEVLALLNLYPFEQYVHWEKCTHENKQMYCRDGCRCEQQYRLHRLLAYDPNNECRGIFSDWFKFPSCCICRCYDLPVEFRVTSRSPRNLQRQRLKVRAPSVPPKRQRQH